MECCYIVKNGLGKLLNMEKRGKAAEENGVGTGKEEERRVVRGCRSGEGSELLVLLATREILGPLRVGSCS